MDIPIYLLNLIGQSDAHLEIHNVHAGNVTIEEHFLEEGSNFTSYLVLYPGLEELDY